MGLNYGIRIAAHRDALAVAPQIFGPTLPARCDASIAQWPMLDRWPIHGPLSPRDREGRCLLEIAALPSFTSPFRWRLVAQLPGAYETREIDVLALRMRPAPAGPEAPWRLVQRHPSRWTPAALQAATAHTAQIFLGFSRFPAARSFEEPDGSTTVTWSDMRFVMGPPRTRADRQRAGFFSATVRVGADGTILQERLGE
jgi:hypothetical protein